MIGWTNTSGGGLNIQSNKAVIHVTAPVGSTISFEYGGIVVAVLEQKYGFINADDSSMAEWYYSVSNNNLGEWSITATKGEEQDSKIIEISSEIQYDVLLHYNFYIVKDGILREGLVIEKTTNVPVFMQQNDGYVLIKSQDSSSAYGRIYGFPKRQVFSYFTLTISEGKTNGSWDVYRQFGIKYVSGGLNTNNFISSKSLPANTTYTTTTSWTVNFPTSVISDKALLFAETGASQYKNVTQLYFSKQAPT